MIEELLEQLYIEVGKIDPDAEKYLREDATKLSSYDVEEMLEEFDVHSMSTVLLSLFTWNESEQGSMYWCKIMEKLIEKDL